MARSGYFVVDYIDAGRPASRKVYTESEPTAYNEITAEGHHVTYMQFHPSRFWDREVYPLQYKMAFLRGLARFVQKGYSPGAALTAIVEAESEPRIRMEMQGALAVVKRGGTFSDAVGQLGMFSAEVKAMIKAGESAGRMADALASASAYMEERKGVMAMAKLAMVWIIIELISGVSAALTTKYMLVPMVTNMLASLPADTGKLETATITETVAAANYNNDLLILITVAAMVVAAVLWAAYKTSAAARVVLEPMLLRVPIVRELILHNGMNVTMQVAGRLVGSGVHLSRAIPTVLGASVSPRVTQYWQGVLDRLHRGMPVDVALHQDSIILQTEKVGIRSTTDAQSVAQELTELATFRKDAYVSVTKRLNGIGFYATMGYIAIVGWVGWGVVDAQNAIMNAMFGGIG